MRNGSCKSLKCKEGGKGGGKGGGFLDGLFGANDDKKTRYKVGTISFIDINPTSNIINTLYKNDKNIKIERIKAIIDSIKSNFVNKERLSMNEIQSFLNVNAPLNEYDILPYKQNQFILFDVIQSNKSSINYSIIENFYNNLNLYQKNYYGFGNKVMNGNKEAFIIFGSIEIIPVVEEINPNQTAVLANQVKLSGGGKSNKCAYSKTSKKIVAKVNGVTRERCVYMKNGNEYVRYKGGDNVFKYKKV